MPNFPILVQST